MRPRVEVREGRPWDCGAAIHCMREKHREALAALGQDPHRELRLIFDQSAYTRACIVNGRIAAVWGVSGCLMSNYGYAWLLLTDQALKFPVELFRQARCQLAEIMETYVEIATTVIASDESALRFALALGFHARDDEPIKDRKALARALQADENLKLPVGAGFVIPLGCHAPREG